MTYTIEATGLTKGYGGAPVLRGLDLRVRSASVLALLGSNGTGKTTTVRILSTLLRADAGSARVAGHDVATAPGRVRAAISLTGQHASVDGRLTGRENVRMMCRLRHLDRRRGRRRADELLARFELEEAADRRAETYSGGMARRLDLAMSLVSDPAVLFLDEPTTGLDPRSRREVWAAVAALRDAGVTVLLTTQYLEEADRLADRIVVLHGGRAVAEGTSEELKAQAGGETVVLFLGDERAVEAARRAVPHAHADPETLSVRVPTDGSARGVKVVLDALEHGRIAVERMALHRPTLDDVFLDVTEGA